MVFLTLRGVRMSINAGSVPYNLGDLVTITSDGNGKVYFWYASRDGVLHGLWMDTRNPETARLIPGENEIVVRRGGGADTSTRMVRVGAPGAIPSGGPPPGAPPLIS